MAKKTAKFKPNGVGKKQSRRSAEKVLRSGPIRKRARTAALPGMEDARVEALDDIAASIADCREKKNALAAEEKQLLLTALRLLQEHKRTVWKHEGVELVRVPGDEHVRVRLVKGEAADDEDDDDGDVFADDAELATGTEP